MSKTLRKYHTVITEIRYLKHYICKVSKVWYFSDIVHMSVAVLYLYL